MDIVFFDKDGMAQCYTEDKKEIYSYEGRPLGVFDREYIFSFKGHNIGWIDNGVVRDISGDIVFFTQHAGEDMPLPARRSIPAKSAKQIPPQHIATTVTHTCSVKSYAWSHKSIEEFFELD